MEYNWTISAFDCAVKQDKFSNVIVTVHWRYSATDADGNTAETYGATSLGPPTGSFTPYDKLTKEQVIGWLEKILNVDEMQANLAAQIELIKNPVKVTLTPNFYDTTGSI